MRGSRAGIAAFSGGRNAVLGPTKLENNIPSGTSSRPLSAMIASVVSRNFQTQALLESRNTVGEGGAVRNKSAGDSASAAEDPVKKEYRRGNIDSKSQQFD